MKKAMLYVTSAMIGVALFSCPAGAQGTSQAVDLAKVDVQKLSAGYPASKVVPVLNDANETIGKIDDLLVSPDGRAPFAVLSIGGFLGLGTHLVVVRNDSLKLVENKAALPGGTKEMLKMLPGSSTPRSDSPTVALQTVTRSARLDSSSWRLVLDLRQPVASISTCTRTSPDF